MILSVTRQNVIILNTVMLNVVIPRATLLNVVILSGVMLNAIILSVTALNINILSDTALNIIILSVARQNVVILSVVVLIVTVPEKKDRPEASNSLLQDILNNSMHFNAKMKTCGLYYKTITIVIMMIVSDDTIWSVTYNHN
jgi:hypothetical protein